jgi:hypothetical protein
LRHLVCIISDQAVPNLLFIRQFGQPSSDFFFISSQEMEEKRATQNLIAALKLPQSRCHTILIDANDALKIFDQLRAFPFPKEAEYLVNITGGNKLMSQMVFQHFLDFDSRMLYSPIDSGNYQQLYPDVFSMPKDPEIKLSLFEYLYAYGFEVVSDVPYFKGNPKPTVLFRKVLHADGAGKVPEIAKAIAPDYKEEDKNYLSGGWFEFYCYQFFKRIFRLGDSQIACSVGLKKIDGKSVYEHDNEFDLMFVHQNDLYIFECKVYSSPIFKKEKFQAPMFKLASLTQKFGLKCKKYLAILATLPESADARDQLEQLRRNLGIDRLITLEDFGKYTDQTILTFDSSPKLSFAEKLDLLKEKFKG